MSIYKKDKIKYDIFHNKTKSVSKVIDENNYTYINVIRFINKCRIFDKNLKILDIGCGTGTIDFFLANRGHTVYGIDISKKVINNNKQSAINVGLSLLTHFYQSNYPSQVHDHIKNNRYDIAFFLEVLEHLVDDEQAIKVTANMIRNNGYFLISVPLKNAPLFRLGLLKSFEERVGHLRRYDKRDIELLLNKHNFNILYTIETEGALRNALFTSRFTGVILKLIKGRLSLVVTEIDNLFMKLFGASNLIIFAQKK